MKFNFRAISPQLDSPQLLQSLEFQYLYNSLIIKVSNVRRVANFRYKKLIISY